MNDPQLDDEFVEIAICDAGHLGEVNFHFNHGSSDRPVGRCEECDAVVVLEKQEREP